MYIQHWFDRRRLKVEHCVSSSLLDHVDPSFRTLYGRRSFTVRRHKFKKDSFYLFIKPAEISSTCSWRAIPGAERRETLRVIACVSVCTKTRNEREMQHGFAQKMAIALVMARASAPGLSGIEVYCTAWSLSVIVKNEFTILWGSWRSKTIQ